MAWVALNCPQCSAPLPRVAIWRSVKCGSCGALIIRTESVVLRDTFRQALVRSWQNAPTFEQGIQCGGERYHLMQLLDNGEISQVYLARRSGYLPFLATIKLSSAPSAATRYAREALVLRELHASQNGTSLFQRLPEVVAQGVVVGNTVQQALVMRHPNGFWGSLAALNDRFAQGIDPRHAVWIWRRILDVLSFIHTQGWSHGDVRPEHALVHPQDHGIRLVGWASAQKDARDKDQAQARDLMRSARVVLVLLGGATEVSVAPSHVPKELAHLVTRASQDDAFCRSQGAEGLDSLLRAAAKTAYGPPTFVPLTI